MRAGDVITFFTPDRRYLVRLLALFSGRRVRQVEHDYVIDVKENGRIELAQIEFAD